ncbi:MAG: orotate phosphoribosyltransferase [Proteobacteria bacterium]|nr:orotate phosphoribosyltransferase [Pseudomonadota bacterium]
MKLTLEDNEAKFLDLLLEAGVLRFGDFLTKSGRKSPYFFNTGNFDSGRVLNGVAQCYSRHIVKVLGLAENPTKKIHLYGPAYKGIPLATSISQQLFLITGRDVPFTFNRKEVKSHGEGGRFIGRKLESQDRVIVVEDVITGGTSIRESLELLKPLGVVIEAVVVGVDREERGLGTVSASQELSKDFGIPVYSLLKLTDIVQVLSNEERLGRRWIDDETANRIQLYRQSYCSP